MAQKKILTVDDEADISELVKYNLAREGFAVEVAASGEDALKLVRREPPDLILLDLMLPGIDGLEVLRILKRDEKYAHVPVIILSVRGDDVDVVTGLELGAADYVVKPFSPRILVSRVKAVLRRHGDEGPAQRSFIKVNGLEIDPLRHEVIVNGKNTVLTPTEFGLLHFLARKPGRVFTRSQIIDGVKGECYASTDRAVDVQLVGLRKKLGSCGRLIKTVHGVGYKFEDDSVGGDDR